MHIIIVQHKDVAGFAERQLRELQYNMDVIQWVFTSGLHLRFGGNALRVRCKLVRADRTEQVAGNDLRGLYPREIQRGTLLGRVQQLFKRHILLGH